MTIDHGARDQSDAPIPDDKHDVFAFADDGEHATVWGIDRVASQTLEVTYYRCKAGLVEQVGPVEQFDISSEAGTKDWARTVAAETHEEAVRLTRLHWDSV